MANIEGTCKPGFDGLKDVLAELIDSGADIGASVAVVREGVPVVDIWGGHCDEARTTPWQQDTITNVWSTTKTMVALAVLMLIDRGLVHEDDPVAKHWPEFAANDKGAVTIGHLMSHTSGVSGWEQPIAFEDVYDLPTSTATLAAQAPWWEPGTASGYHALNYGHLLGEVIRRVTGKSLRQFVAEEIAGPLGADFQIGAAEADYGRIAPITPPPPMELPPGIDPESVAIKTFTGPATDALVALTPQWRQAEIGGANGHSNARGVARIQSVLSNGGQVDGVRLLSPETIARVFRAYSDGPDLVLGMSVRFGLGFSLSCDATPYVEPGESFFWGGWGGSLVVNDRARRCTIAYMMNRMSGESLLGNASSRKVHEAAIALLDAAG